MLTSAGKENDAQNWLPASATIDRARAALHAVPGADAMVGGRHPDQPRRPAGMARLGIEVQLLAVGDLADEALEGDVQRKLTVRNTGEIAAQAWRTGIVTGRPQVSPAWLR